MRHHHLGLSRPSPTLLARTTRRCYSAARSRAAPPAHLVNSVYQPNPQPFNCTTLSQTRVFATDPSHPLFHKIRRRAAAHDPQDFRWVVRCPVDLNKKSTYRHAVQKKLRRAFRHALTQRGFNDEGKPLSDSNRVANAAAASPTRGSMGRISGALCMTFVNDPQRVFTAKGCDFRAEAERILDRLLQARHAASRVQQPGRYATVKRPLQMQRQGNATVQRWQPGKRQENPPFPRP
ncbi:hypothetical protein CERZMDRAFT_86968 [Cercospora zeae-maydis SCOH1-5]|uniref:Uncharacterized protein n=1 Tax=Cercospora zeae-maydis SCOH1-5 TaxID=717836 RepID=A0A6A6F7E9_9PEZI|nr:hypothetical protein CERZMDRAFT_86968 [Cercospora zeae-maydis SCOH1-5]